MFRETQKKWIKEKVTLTLNPRLLKEVDRWSKQIKMKSRSAAIAKLIEQWILEKNKKCLEAQTEAYYLSLSEAEKKEDKDWTEFSSHQTLRRLSQ